MLYYGIAVLALCLSPLVIAIIGSLREWLGSKPSLWAGSRGWRS